MSKWRKHWASLAVAVFVVAAAGAGAACGGGGAGGPMSSDGGDAGVLVEAGKKPARDAAKPAPEAGKLGNNTLTSITVTPSTPTIRCLNGAKAKQAFTATGSYADGSQIALTSGVTWSADQLGVGSIDGTGLFTASGATGGVVDVTATYKGFTASTSLTVVLWLRQNPAGVPTSVQTALGGATTPDSTVVWAYPYGGTVWPRGLMPPILQWNGGAATDDYDVTIKSATFELQLFTTATGAPASQIALDATTWGQFTDSTSGSAELTVTRWNGTTATRITSEAWTISPASMRGTVYYWANNLGRIMRLTPGGTPDDFSAGVVPAPTQGCTMACHTVAASGSAMTVAGGTFGGTYDLQNNTMGYSVGAGENSGPIRQWGLAAMSPKGAYVVVDALADALTGLTPDGMYQASDGGTVASSGLSTTEKAFMPAFSPDGTSLVLVSGTNPGTAYWLATGAAGPTAPTDPTWGLLRAYDFNAAGSPMLRNERTLITPGTDPSDNVIAWPTVSPDGRWVVYGRLGWIDPGTQYNLSSYPPVLSDLYMADIQNPGTEVRLAALDGDNYPFAAGARDLHLNFEPSLAPVASGGYFWVVFHSRRTYGNILTGDRTTEKQLWVAAIDQSPKPGTDPSHAAFWLPGQDTTTLNLRGFWSLPPCKNDGSSCATGTDCCGGYCAPTGEDAGVVADAGKVADAAAAADAGGVGDGGAQPAGAGVCRSSTSTGCAADGDKCSKSGDCCGASQGVTCINHVCSEPPPR